MPLVAETAVLAAAGEGSAVVGGILFFGFIGLYVFAWLRPKHCRHCGRCPACGRQR